MPDGFRIASGFVQVDVTLDAEQGRKAGEQASRDVADGINRNPAPIDEAGSKAGERMGEKMSDGANKELAAGGEDIKKTTEEIGDESGKAGGDKLGDGLSTKGEEKLRKAKDKFKKTTEGIGDESGKSGGEKLGDGLTKGLGKFDATFEKAISDAISRLPTIDPKADFTQADEQVAFLRAELETLKKQRIGVDFDDKEALAKVLALKTALSGMGDNGKGGNRLRFDTDAAAHDLAKLGVVFKDIAVKGAKDLEQGIELGGQEGFKSLAASLQGFLSSPVLGPAVTAGIVGAIVAASPFIGGALGGALLAGVASAGIGVAIADQLDNPAVQAATTTMKFQIGNALKEATSSFAPVLELAATKFGGMIGRMEPQMEGMFQRLAPVAGRLFDGFDGLITNIMPGFEKAIDAGGRVLDRVSQELPGLGKAFSTFFSSVASGSQGGSDALGALIRVMEILLVATGSILDVLSKMFVGIEIAGDIASGKVGEAITSLGSFFTGSQDAAAGTGNFADKAKVLAGNLDDMTSSAQSATDQVLLWNNAALTAKGDALAWADSLDALKTQLKGNKAGLTDSTAAGRSNEEMYLSLVQKIQDNANATYKSTGSAILAAQAYSKQKAQLDATAKAAGATAKEIAALNKGLDNAVKIRKGSVTITVTVKGNGQNLVTRSDSDTTLIAGTGIKFRRWGGVDGWADEGLITGKLGNSSAGVYSGQNGPVIGFAEPETGRELFMPERGDPVRNKSLAAVAAQWAGGTFVPQPTSGGSSAGAIPASTQSMAQRVLQPVSINVGGAPLLDLVLSVVEGNPTVVSATAAEGDRQRAGLNPGFRAQGR